VTADYDKIVELFEDLELYLNRLKILEKWVPPELEVALTEVLTSVLVLCGICAKYIKIRRFGETFASSPPLRVFLKDFHTVSKNLFQTQTNIQQLI
jgi:hypothetical protein